jgi:hypothetical protein
MSFALGVGSTDPDQQNEASTMMPLDFSLEMDGISGIIPNSAFEVPASTLPNSYLTKAGGKSKIAFILHTVDHNFSNNKWTTKITGQTLNIRFDSLTPQEKSTRKAQQETPYTPSTTGDNILDLPPMGEKSDFWALVALSAGENYPDNSQGMADVAQSIYNRLGAKAYGSSIKKIVIAKGQYEPTFNNAPQWKAIQNKETAIVAYQNSKRVSRAQAEKVINTSYNAIQNQTLMQNAASFVGSRTEFLAAPPSDPKSVGVVERNPKSTNNAFYWRYAGKDKFYNPKSGYARNALPKPTGFTFIPNS